MSPIPKTKQKAKLSMNENTNTTPAPELTVGLPPGLNPTAVLARKSAMIAAGMEPLLAEKLAIDAEREQARRDSLETRTTATKKEAKK
jgi:hypothetical protein